MDPRAEKILEDWFSDPARWWKKDPEFDQYLAKTYSEDLEAALSGARDDWAETPRGALALIICLDQFSRNIHRDTPQMYAADEKAVGLTLAALEAKFDQQLANDDERAFLYMPLMHSEDRDAQTRALEVFKGHAHEQYAIDHAKIVHEWGRFPHRNAILGRASTPEELEFLKTPGSSF